MLNIGRLFALLLLSCMLLVCRAEDRVVGGDISLIPAYEQAGDQWLDADGNIIPDLITFLHDEVGWTAARVRLLVDPTRDSDPGTCQDLEYVKQLGRRIKEAGMLLLLDIFYSDTWTDPAQQWIPQSWNMDKTTATNDLADKVRYYTIESINALVEAGASPDYVQIGNEVSYGMLWDNLSAKDKSRHVIYLDPQWFSYERQEAQIVRFASLLGAAAEGVRASNAKEASIVLHIERSGEPEWARNFYDWLAKAGFTDYDIIGLSYYPFWHGSLSTLSSTVKTLREALPEKDIHLVETAYNYQWGYPNIWAPYQYFDYNALNRYGLKKEAEELRKNYMNLLETVFDKTGALWERYDENGNAKDLEYPTQEMLGWTAGVYNFLYADRNKK